MIIKEVTNIVEDFAPLNYAESFDNVGLLVGDFNTKVRGILVSHDTLEVTIDEAIEKKCNLIISFHPIIFKGLKRLNGNTYVEKIVIKAIKNNIAIYAIHTALDNSVKGVSAKMAEVLKLKNTKILIPQKGVIKKLTTYVPHKNADLLRKSLFKAGAGNIGNYNECSFNVKGEGTFNGNKNSNPTLGEKGKLQTEPETMISVVYEKHKESKILKSLFQNHPYEEVAYEIITLDNFHQNIGMGTIGELEKEQKTEDFFKVLKQVFKLKTFRYSAICKKTIKKVALLGGSGSFAIKNAKRANADIFITADLKYHDFYLAENQIILADIGHYESEQFTKNILVDYLTEKFSNFAPALEEGRIIISEKNTNPINYI